MVQYFNNEKIVKATECRNTLKRREKKRPADAKFQLVGLGVNISHVVYTFIKITYFTAYITILTSICMIVVTISP